MGQKDDTQIKKQIMTEITSQIEIDTKNITDITNTSITDVVADMILKTSASVVTNTNNINELNFNNMELEEGSNFDFTQDATVTATNTAINKIAASSESMSTLISDIMNEVKSKIEGDIKAEQSAKNLASIKETEKKDGGIEGIVNDLTAMASKMVNAGGETTVKTEEEIRTVLKNAFKSMTTSEVNLKHMVDSAIKSLMQLESKGECVFNAVGGNKANFNNGILRKYSEYKNKQTSTSNVITDCLNNLNIGTKITNALTGRIQEKLGMSSAIKQGVTQKGDAQGETDKTKVSTSSISKVMGDAINLIGTMIGSGMFLIIGGIVLFLGLIGFVIYSFTGGGGSGGVKNVSEKVIDIDEDEDEDGYKKGRDDNERAGGDNEQAGGDIFSGFTNSNTDGNIYLLAIILVIINTLARKSIPLCGVLLIVIFLYFVYKKNPKLFRI